MENPTADKQDDVSPFRLRLSKPELRDQAYRLAGMLPHLNALYDPLAVAVMVINPSQQIVFCNQFMARMAGVSSVEELRGLKPCEALHCAHAANEPGCENPVAACPTCEMGRRLQAALDQQAEQRWDYSLLTRTHDAAELQFGAMPLPMTGGEFILVTLQDISDSRQRATLERVFFHDIMNTAVGLRGLAELLLLEQDPPSALVTKINAGAYAMVEEIGGFRDLRDIEKNTFTPQAEPVASLDLLRELAEQASATELARDRRVTVADDAAVVDFKCDRVLLARVLAGLVRRALEVCQPGQAVTLACAPQDDRIRFTVHNPGLIPAEEQTRLFHRDFKGRNRDWNAYSLRLICERALGGSVTFTSRDPEGTTFVAAIPRGAAGADPKPVVAAATPPAPVPLVPGRVLVAEDNSFLGQIVAGMLRKNGFEPVLVANGQEAMELQARQPCAIILMDVEMPVLDGHETTRRLRAQSGARPYIIGLTAHRGAEDQAQCMAAGMDDVLTKPLKPEQLLMALGKAGPAPTVAS